MTESLTAIRKYIRVVGGQQLFPNITFFVANASVKFY
jgi:hypothetical protein